MPDPKRPTSRTKYDEELKVGPIEAESAAQIYARLELQEMERRRAAEEPPKIEPFAPPGNGLTFSLRQLLIGITVLSVWFGLLRWMNSLKTPILTGLFGIAALAVLFWISVREESSPQTKLLWWAMLLTYATSAAITLM